MTTANHNPKLSSLYSRIARIRQESANLKQSVEKLRAGADLLGDPLGDMKVCTYAMAPDGTILAASPALVRLLGYESLDELRVRNTDGGEYDAEYVQALFARHGGQINDIESIWRRKDGSIIHVRESARAVYDERGRPIEYDGIIEKIVGPVQVVEPPTTDETNNGQRTTEKPGKTYETKPIFALLSEAEQPAIEADAVALTPQPPLPLRQERGSGDAETRLLFALPSEAEQPPSEAAADDSRTTDDETKLMLMLPSVAERAANEVAADDLQRTTDNPSPSLRTGGQPTIDVLAELLNETAAAETKPMLALSSEAEQPKLELENRRTGEPENRRTNKEQTAENTLHSPRTTDNKQRIRGAALQRAVERLKGQITTASAGEDRRSLLGGSMELREYWKIIRKRLWLILLLMLIGGSVSGYFAYQQPPKYRTTTTLYLNPAAANALMASQYDTLASLAQTYTEFMKTRSFASQVAEKITLDTGTIISALSTEYVANTQFYRITATYSDPQMTQSLANIAAKVLIDQNIARQQAEQEQIQAQSQPDPERDRLIEVRTSLQNELDIYNGQITTTQAKLDELVAQPKSEANDKQILALQSQLTTFQSSRLSAINGLADTQAALATTEATAAPNLDTAVVVDVATLPSAPLPDTTIQTILIALLAGLSVGAALAFLLEYMDYTIKTPEAMEAIYGSATQGAIGLAGGKRVTDRSPTQLVTLNDPHSQLAESFRALRTGVGVAGLIGQMRSLMVTSARPGEGKTFIAANLAVSLAQNGNRVILVDADLRKPSLHYVFDLQLDPGFTNLMLDQSGRIEDFLQPTNVENLRILTCGIIPPNPAELLGSPRAAAVMEQLIEYADIVVYDSPPAATVVDAVVMGPRVDAVLHVIHAGKTRIDLVRRCKALLERGGAHILGPVLNQVSLPELRAYSYYYSYSYKQAGGKSAKRSKGAPSKAKISSNGATVRSK